MDLDQDFGSLLNQHFNPVDSPPLQNPADDQAIEPVSCSSQQVSGTIDNHDETLPEPQPHGLPKPTPTISNIASLVQMGCKFNLQQISDSVRDAEYNPRRSPALTLRVTNPKGTVLVNAGGSMVCTGTKCEEDLKQVAEKCAKLFRKLGFPAKVLGYKIQFMHAHFNMGFTVKLDELTAYAVDLSKQKSLKIRCTYNPEIFPGVQLFIPDVSESAQVRIFRSGKVSITGVKSAKQVEEAFERVYPMLVMFRKDKQVPIVQKPKRPKAVKKPVEKAFNKMFNNITENNVGNFMDEFLGLLSENSMNDAAGTIRTKLKDWKTRMQLKTVEDLMEISDADEIDSDGGSKVGSGSEDEDGKDGMDIDGGSQDEDDNDAVEDDNDEVEDGSESEDED